MSAETTKAQDAPFELCGPLPEGVTVLEASAGTGKTFTIAGLAARYVAEGVPLGELLVITFTRMATAELRDRVRERLVSAEHGLERALAGEPPDGRDGVLALLATGTADEVARRWRRLAAAVADFDAATIVTTHGFCQEVLGGLGIAGDLEPGAAFVEDLGDLVEEVADDLYVAAFHGREEAPFPRAQAQAIARAADRNPGAPIEPADPEAGSVPDLRRRLAARVRAELEERKRRLGVMTYDDLLTKLDGALRGGGGEAIARRLRSRYRVVLVDEFQDTDPIQWSIVRRAFATGDATLVLIGDPKQAIYAFRGADVYAYLDAAQTAGARATLGVNWRSDQGLIDAYDGLFGTARLGHEGIAYRRVHAAAANVAARLTGAPHPAPLRVRIVHRDDPSVGTTGGGFAPAEPAREHIAEDLAADVVALLSCGAEIERRHEDGTVAAREGVAPGHLAVLVRRNLDAELVRDALARADVPAVLNGAGSVFDTGAARDWLHLLEALERPTSIQRSHAAALTAFVGWSARRVALAGDEDWEDVHARLHVWAGILRARGVAALSETIMHSERVAERVLEYAEGERRLTDLRHVGELLHGAAMEDELGVTALATWLRRRIDAAADELGNEERSRRLESDEDAVQILTIHRSKGLEFPIVYLPYLWHPSPVARTGDPVTFHDAADANRRKVDVGLDGRGYHDHRRQSVAEQRGEDLRLMYVALTRARHQAVVWWAGTRDSRHSALGRLVFFRDEDGTVAESGSHTPDDAAATAAFEALAAATPGACIGVERSRLGRPASWSGPLRRPIALEASTFGRELDRRWRRTSYSDLTAGAHDPVVGSEPEEPEGVADEPAAPPPGAAPAAGGEDEAALRAVPSLLAEMPVGLRIGTFVHELFEAVDFAAGDLGAELEAQAARAHERRAVDLGDRAAALAGLRAAIETPLGPLVDGLALRDVARADRLNELDFELPLAGGDAPTGRVTLAAIASVLRGDPALAPYAERLGDPALRPSVRGYLAGSIDLVVRLPGRRFAIADYKTNWLAAPGEELTAWHHRPAALAAEMQRMHYVLQALLYTVALHRYLRWRVPGYDAGRDLAGVLYLFVRGMTGPATPVVDGAPCGVFAWRPPAEIVHELSDVLDRGEAA